MLRSEGRTRCLQEIGSLAMGVDVVREFIDKEEEDLFVSLFEEYCDNHYSPGSLGQLYAVRMGLLSYSYESLLPVVGDIEERVAEAAAVPHMNAQWMVSYDPHSHLTPHRDGDYDNPFRNRSEYPTAILNLNNEVDTFNWDDDKVHLKPRDLIVGNGYAEHGFDDGAIVDKTKIRYSILFREG